MTTEKLYDIIKVWRDSCDTAGLYLVAKDMDTTLKQLEADNASVGVDQPVTSRIASSASNNGMQLSFFQLDDPVLCQIRDEILGLDINNLTPVEALNKLNEIKKIVTGRS